MIDKDYSFTVTNDKGQEVTCDTLAYISREEEQLNPIIIYTDYTKGEDNLIKLYVSELIPAEDGIALGKIQDEDYEKIPRIREIMEEIWKNNSTE